MTINAAAFIPPAFEMPRVHMDGDDIIRSEVRQLGNVKINSGVTTQMPAEKLPVQPDLAVAKNAIELQFETLTLKVPGDEQMFPIPRSGDWQITVVALVGRIVSSIQHVIMRQIYRLPLGVSVAGGNHFIAVRNFSAM